MIIFEKKINSVMISTDIKLIDFDYTYHFLKESYWAKNIPRNIFNKSLKNSLCFGVFKENQQVGFARVISDYSTFAYLGDLFIDADCRGLGYSKLLMDTICVHPELQGLRRFCLGTKDAHSLYSHYDFKVIERPENWMEIKRNNSYENL